MNLKYIYPKKINLDNFKILETHNSYKLKYYDNIVDLYGILILINDYEIIKNLDNYIIKVKDTKNLEFYDDYLSSKIPNYKKILKDSSFIIKCNKINKTNNFAKKNTIYT